MIPSGAGGIANKPGDLGCSLPAQGERSGTDNRTGGRASVVHARFFDTHSPLRSPAAQPDQMVPCCRPNPVVSSLMPAGSSRPTSKLVATAPPLPSLPAAQLAHCLLSTGTRPTQQASLSSRTRRPAGTVLLTRGPSPSRSL